MMDMRRVPLNDGSAIPQLGLGVFRLKDDAAERIVNDAFSIGYRHIDTAAIYGNEIGVGRAIATSRIPRDQLFITTKLWNSDQGRTAPITAINRSLERLGLDYVDLYLIHWPVPKNGLFVDSWLALEQIKENGLTRSIGVSNFEISHLKQITMNNMTIPAVNQIELHPAFSQRQVRTYCAERDIRVAAWGPLGQGKYQLLESRTLTSIARLYGKTPAQVVIRWHLQSGNIVFPMSSKVERLAENFSVFDFSLTEEQMAAVDAMNSGTRVGENPNNFG